MSQPEHGNGVLPAVRIYFIYTACGSICGQENQEKLADCNGYTNVLKDLSASVIGHVNMRSEVGW